MTNIRNVITSKDLPPPKTFAEGINEYVFWIFFSITHLGTKNFAVSNKNAFQVKWYKKDIKNLYLLYLFAQAFIVALSLLCFTHVVVFHGWYCQLTSFLNLHVLILETCYFSLIIIIIMMSMCRTIQAKEKSQFTLNNYFQLKTFQNHSLSFLFDNFTLGVFMVFHE